MKMRHRDKANKTGLEGAALAALAQDAAKRYGTAIKENLVAYSGIDNEFGKVMKRSLKGISEYRVNSNDVARNLKQHAGFGAEVVEVARRRSKEAIEGKTPTTVRTDDIPGHVNDQLFDITSKIDVKGDPIPGSSAQMKFEGASAKAAVSKLLDKHHEKYIDNNCKMVVPKDYFKEMKEELGKKAESYREQVESLAGIKGKENALANAKRQLEKCETLEKNLESSKVTNAQALQSVTKPGWFTFKEVVGYAHQAGLEQAKFGAVFGGGISLFRNLVQMYSGEKSVWDAAKSVAVDATSVAATSYATAALGAIFKGTAQNSTATALRGLAKTNLPAFIATGVVETGKIISKYYCGVIDGAQCIDQLGEFGFSMVSASVYATIGQAVIPVPVVGALMGSMFGYLVASSAYKELKESLCRVEVAKKRRMAIERECEACVAYYRECRKRVEEIQAAWLRSFDIFFDDVFASMKMCLEIGDSDGYVDNCNRVLEYIGSCVRIPSREKFVKFMTVEKDKPLIV